MDTTSSSQRAYQATKDRILSGGIRGGQLLSEVEVANELGVSRTPVHEAFLRLAAEDLLELLPRRGAVVVPVPPQEATDLLEMRLALETAAVRRLCRTPEAVDALFTGLNDLVDEQRRLADTNDTRAFAAADDAFHRRIVEVAGNPIGQRFYGSLSDRQRRMMADAARSDSTRLEALIGEHAGLAAAIERRDVEEFESALLSHLEATYRVSLQ
ncbi:GntR family transcriptional regulator [Mycolicibacterium goodii]|uniref:GntR family transcriptional regulator n=1 Tax=Mycolicibacterium goodii TaxID=134601 RepID=UPI000C266CBD|nr:GntR family transcriptional regulator [Mycolicibacterium goodii]MBU8829884.1 GntR family transcriptional regulator [Mycolicibacterium goodii]PJK20994.1 GntR family transcriptional regulator [Mycolicibacterium goodii]